MNYEENVLKNQDRKKSKPRFKKVEELKEEAGSNGF